MRLLNTATFELGQFEGEDIPEYAILSHTWADDEILFHDLSGTPSPRWRQKKAFYKVEGCCRKARRHNYQWIWIDTCCIDKTSSAELSEAINSMFRYYQDSKVCYVYMTDLEPGEPMHSGNRWFTRGWTLQELIAPRDVRFYNAAWDYVGDKLSLSQPLADITGVDAYVLERGNCVVHYTPENWTRSVDRWKRCNCPHDIAPILDVLASTGTAKIMSWASRRKTKKEEDLSYSLMGLFDVNMPLLYGEGSKAFVRLQNEIVRKRKDQSILAWRNPETRLPPRGRGGESPRELPPIARSPAMFQLADGIGASSSISSHGVGYSEPYMSFVDGNLTTELLLCPIIDRDAQPRYAVEVFAAILDATIGSNPLCRPVILVCRDVEDFQRSDMKFRRLSELLYYLAADGSDQIRVLGGQLRQSLTLDIKQKWKSRVTFVSEEERRHTDFQKSLSLVQVVLQHSVAKPGSVKYEIDWRNCKESGKVMGQEPGMGLFNKSERTRTTKWEQRGVVSFVASNGRHPRFVVVWVVWGVGDAKMAFEGDSVCKIWSHRDLARQFLDPDGALPLELDQRQLDLVLAQSDLYRASWDLQHIKDTIVLGARRRGGEAIEISARIEAKTFLERTVLELEVDARLLEPGYGPRPLSSSSLESLYDRSRRM